MDCIDVRSPTLWLTMSAVVGYRFLIDLGRPEPVKSAGGAATRSGKLDS